MEKHSFELTQSTTINISESEIIHYKCSDCNIIHTSIESFEEHECSSDQVAESAQHDGILYITSEIVQNDGIPDITTESDQIDERHDVTMQDDLDTTELNATGKEYELSENDRTELPISKVQIPETEEDINIAKPNTTGWTPTAIRILLEEIAEIYHVLCNNKHNHSSCYEKIADKINTGISPSQCRDKWRHMKEGHDFYIQGKLKNKPYSFDYVHQILKHYEVLKERGLPLDSAPLILRIPESFLPEVVTLSSAKGWSSFLMKKLLHLVKVNYSLITNSGSLKKRFIWSRIAARLNSNYDWKQVFEKWRNIKRNSLVYHDKHSDEAAVARSKVRKPLFHEEILAIVGDRHIGVCVKSAKKPKVREKPRKIIDPATWTLGEMKKLVKVVKPYYPAMANKYKVEHPSFGCKADVWKTIAESVGSCHNYMQCWRKWRKLTKDYKYFLTVMSKKVECDAPVPYCFHELSDVFGLPRQAWVDQLKKTSLNKSIPSPGSEPVENYSNISSPTGNNSDSIIETNGISQNDNPLNQNDLSEDVIGLEELNTSNMEIEPKVNSEVAVWTDGDTEKIISTVKDHYDLLKGRVGIKKKYVFDKIGQKLGLNYTSDQVHQKWRNMMAACKNVITRRLLKKPWYFDLIADFVDELAVMRKTDAEKDTNNRTNKLQNKSTNQAIPSTCTSSSLSEKPPPANISINLHAVPGTGEAIAVVKSDSASMSAPKGILKTIPDMVRTVDTAADAEKESDTKTKLRNELLNRKQNVCGAAHSKYIIDPSNSLPVHESDDIYIVSWTTDIIRQLLSRIYNNCEYFKHNKNSLVWKLISSQLNMPGFTFSRCDHKWRNLINANNACMRNKEPQNKYPKFFYEVLAIQQKINSICTDTRKGLIGLVGDKEAVNNIENIPVVEFSSSQDSCENTSEKFLTPESSSDSVKLVEVSDSESVGYEGTCRDLTPPCVETTPPRSIYFTRSQGSSSTLSAGTTPTRLFQSKHLANENTWKTMVKHLISTEKIVVVPVAQDTENVSVGKNSTLSSSNSTNICEKYNSVVMSENGSCQADVGGNTTCSVRLTSAPKLETSKGTSIRKFDILSAKIGKNPTMGELILQFPNHPGSSRYDKTTATATSPVIGANQDIDAAQIVKTPITSTDKNMIITDTVIPTNQDIGTSPIVEFPISYTTTHADNSSVISSDISTNHGMTKEDVNFSLSSSHLCDHPVGKSFGKVEAAEMIDYIDKKVEAIMKQLSENRNNYHKELKSLKELSERQHQEQMDMLKQILNTTISKRE